MDKLNNSVRHPTEWLDGPRPKHPLLFLSQKISDQLPPVRTMQETWINLFGKFESVFFSIQLHQTRDMIS